MPIVFCDLEDCIHNEGRERKGNNIFGRCKADKVVLQEHEERGYLVCDTYDVIEEEVPEDDHNQCSGN